MDKKYVYLSHAADDLYHLLDRRERYRELELSNYIILYFDVLGYKQQIDSYGEREFLRKLDRAYRKTRVYIESVKSESSFHMCKRLKFKVFSDNILICHEYTQDENIVREFLRFSANLQRSLVCEYGILIRGAITVGRLYIEDDYVYGKGLIKAYELENNIAVYPRIILANDFLLEKAYTCLLQTDIINDNDEYYFLDYLEANFAKFSLAKDDIMPYLYENLIRHRLLIEQGLEKYRKHDTIYQKYLWCKKYHNLVCEQYSFNENFTELTIFD